MKGLLYFMKRYDFTITSDRGLHAQPVAALASIACKSASCVTLEYDGGEIDVSNAIRLMSACISCPAPKTAIRHPAAPRQPLSSPSP